jgi:hypothetical protein
LGYSVAAAAAAVGLSKTAVLRAIQAGLITGTKNEINEWRVDPSELRRLPEMCRLFGAVAGGGEFTTAALAGPGEATRSKTWLSDAQVRRLAGLAASDRKEQQAARMHWWRLVAGVRRSDSPHTIPSIRRSDAEVRDAETVRRKRNKSNAGQARSQECSTGAIVDRSGAAYGEDFHRMPSELLERAPSPTPEPLVTSDVSALVVRIGKRWRGAIETGLCRALETLRRLLPRKLFSGNSPGNTLEGFLIKLIVLGKVFLAHDDIRDRARNGLGRPKSGGKRLGHRRPRARPSVETT